MEPTSRRGFLRVTAASAALATASFGLRGLGRQRVDWDDTVGAPDCPQSLNLTGLGEDELGIYGVRLRVETPWETLEYRLENATIERGTGQIDIPLLYPYTTYQPGQYRYSVRLESGSNTVETRQKAFFELPSYRWFA